MAALILQMRDLEPGSSPHLRYITNTAAALPPAHIARLRELFPGVRLYSMYGLTECKRCTYLPPEQLDHRPGSVGIAIPEHRGLSWSTMTGNARGAGRRRANWSSAARM